MLFIKFALIVYVVGLVNCIFLHKKNLLIFLVSAEFMFLGINLILISFGFILNCMDPVVISFVIFVMTVGESAVGLGLSFFCFKAKGSVKINEFVRLRF